MKSEEINQLVNQFEGAMQHVDGVECWSAVICKSC